MTPQQTPTSTPPSKLGKFQSFVQQVQQKFGQRAKELGEARASGQGIASTALQAVGQTAGLLAQDVPGAAVSTFTPEPVKDLGLKVIKSAAEPFAPAIQKGTELYGGFRERNPELARNLEASLNIASLVPVGGGAKIGAEAVEAGAKTVARGAARTAESVVSSPVVQGVVQGTKNIAQRPGRIIERAGEKVAQKAAERAAVNKTPILEKVFETGVDENVIRNIAGVDKTTPQGKDIIRGYKEVLDTAKTNETRMGSKKRLEIPAGERLIKQFELVDNKRKAVGEEIGERVKALSRDKNVDVSDSLGTVRTVFEENGIGFADDGSIVIPRGSFTSKQRTLIKELWDEISDGGETRSARQVYDLDRLLSTLQRESRFDGLDTVFLALPDGEERNVFSFLRDVFSSKLESVDPLIRELNPDYKKWRDLVDGLEDTLVREIDLKSLSKADRARFTPATLRRITSEAVSQGKFEAIAELLDDAARTLGYEGASPRDILEFATEMRKFYKGSVPKTGFQGIMSEGLLGAPGKLLEAGAPNIADQRKALEELIDALQD